MGDNLAKTSLPVPSTLKLEGLNDEQLAAAADLMSAAFDHLRAEERVAQLISALKDARDQARLAAANHKASILAARAVGLDEALVQVPQ